MDWEEVQLFLALVRERTLSAAAARLGISHSTASRKLAALEGRAPVPLFRRSPDGYATTDAGAAIQEAALKMEADYLELRRRLGAHAADARSTVRVSAPDVLMTQLAPYLDGFTRTEPNILLELNVDNATVDLDRLEADIVLRASRAPEAHLVGSRIASTAWGVYVAKARRKARVDDAQLPWIGFGPSLAALPVARWMRENVPEERVALRTNSTTAAQSYARAALGAACLWCLAGDSDPELAQIAGPLRDVASDLWLLTHPNLHGAKNVAKVRAYLATTLRSLRGRIEGRA